MYTFVDLQNFVFDKILNDGILVPKYVGFGNWYEAFFVVHFDLLCLVQFCWFLIMEIKDFHNKDL
jgi:hypothetical protein